jgi:serine/threonine-protein kinase
MSCPNPDTLGAYLEGSLVPAEREQLAAHLGACGECRSVLATLAPEAGGDAADPAGRLLVDTYRLLRPIGAGGMGRVFAAEHVRLGRRVVVKMLRPELRQHPDVVERFKREARICGSLGSRHIVDVLDFNQLQDGTPFMVMEQLRGEDLAQRLALGGALSPASVVAIMRQICAALACTHAEGILHRDLKPSNVFLCDEEGEGVQVKILDFGISKMLGPLVTLTSADEIVGTPAYLSPEMASAKHKLVGPRSDLFSLGAIAYEALCGRRPFEADSIPALLYCVVHEHPPAPCQLRPDVPPALSDLVMRLLHKDLEARPASAEEVLGELDRIAAAGSERADQPPIEGRAWATPASSLRVAAGGAIATAPTEMAIPATHRDLRPASRARQLALIGGGALLAVGAGLLVWHLLREPAQLDRRETVPAPAAVFGAPAVDFSLAEPARAAPGNPQAAPATQPATKKKIRRKAHRDEDPLL